jgi:viologen exporter family transport system permease protein
VARRPDDIRATVGLWYAVARRSFSRYSTYRVATMAGVFTNVVFGVISSYVYVTLWGQRPHLGGYDVVDAVTYTWIGQALLMPVAVWGGGFQEDFTERIRSGDIAIDLYRPTGLVPWWLASDLGRATFHFLARAAPMLVAGAVLFDIDIPTNPARWLAFAVAAYLAVFVSFGLRFLVSLTAFWLVDSRGSEGIAAVLGIFCSGLALPLVVFPSGLRFVLLHLPWCALVQTPADVWLGTSGGVVGTSQALGFELLWGAVLLFAAYGVLSSANRVVVVQGG